MNDDAGALELTVYYDASCTFCTQVARWLERQPQFVPLRCEPAAAPSEGCPIAPEDLLANLTVVASDGAVYRGANAFLICLWALRAYRGWSVRLSTEAGLPWARRIFDGVARFARVGGRDRIRD